MGSLELVSLYSLSTTLSADGVIHYRRNILDFPMVPKLESISKDFDREQLMQLLIADVGCYTEDFLNHLRPFIMQKHFDVVKSAKFHRCFICHCSIATGQYVYSRTLIIEDKYTGFKLCSLHCLKMFARQLIDKRFPEAFEDLRQPKQHYQRSEDKLIDKTLDHYL